MAPRCIGVVVVWYRKIVVALGVECAADAVHCVLAKRSKTSVQFISYSFTTPDDLQTLNLKTKRVATCVPDRQIIVDTLRLPKEASAFDIEAYLLAHAAKRLRASLEDVCYDFVYQAPNPEVQLFACTKNTLDDVCNPLKKIGLTPTVVESETLAKARAHQNPPPVSLPPEVMTAYGLALRALI